MRWRSFLCAVYGIIAAVRKGKNIRVILVFIGMTVAAGFIFDLPATEWASVLLCCALVFTAEMANTAIEYIVDMISPDYSEPAKKVKDIAAGAVLTASLFAAIIGLVIFIPHIAALIAQN